MNLIERYVSEVGRRLPRKMRTDIEAELRSTLEDMLEDRSQQVGRPVDDAMVEELLTEYGAPKQVAATYQSVQYLIGPRIYPTFILVLKIVMFAVTLGLSIATVISFLQTGMTPPEAMKALAEFAGGLVGALLTAFGNLVLVFTILERVLPASDFEKAEEWTPAELTKEPDPDEVKSAEMIAGIGFTIAALIILNFYPQIVGIWFIDKGAWTQMAGLSDAFFRYLPFINISGILTIALNIFLIRKGMWTTVTRLLSIGSEVITIAIATAILTGPSLLDYFPNAASAEATGVIATIFDKMVPMILIVIIIIAGIEIAKAAFRLFKINYKSKMEYK